MREGYNYHRAHIGFNRSHINIGILNIKKYKIRPFSTYTNTTRIHVYVVYWCLLILFWLKSDIIESTNSTAFLKLRPLLKIKQSWKNWRFLLWNMLIDMITIINVPYTVLYRLHALVWSWSGFLVTNLNKSCSFEWFTRWNKCGKV